MDDEARERKNDKAEDAAAITVEVILALLPVWGGAMAVAFNHAYWSAREKQRKKVVDDLGALLLEHIEAGHIKDPIELLTTPEAIAEVERIVRASMEATSDEKVGLLREVLCGGVVVGWNEEVHDVTEVILRLEPMHVRILQLVAESVGISQLSLERTSGYLGSENREHIAKELAVKGPNRDEMFDAAWNVLSREVLITERTVSNTSGSGSGSQTEHTISGRGKLLLNLLEKGTPPSSRME